MPTGPAQPTRVILKDSTAAPQSSVAIWESVASGQGPRPWLHSTEDSLATTSSIVSPDQAKSSKREEDIMPEVVQSEGFHEGSPEPSLVQKEP
jgi:hypothetical protein